MVFQGRVICQLHHDAINGMMSLGSYQFFFIKIEVITSLVFSLLKYTFDDINNIFAKKSTLFKRLMFFSKEKGSVSKQALSQLLAVKGREGAQ